MQNLVALWQSWDMRRRVLVLGATLAVFAAVLGLARLAATPGMALLYSGLEPAQAGDVVRALEAGGVIHEVRGDSVYVDASQRDSLRLTLAADGLPGNTGAGYELLDGLSGFGTTAQMFDAAYWRAKEGELARTIMASPGLRYARVHIAALPEQPFLRDARPTASVSVEAGAGGIDAAQARAIRHLVAAAVPRLLPQDVAVIDSALGLIDADLDGSDAKTDEQDRAAEIRRNIERLLAARVGPGKAVVEVAVEVVTEDETINERRIDPEERVAIATETVSSSGSASPGGGDVTVASNLPEQQSGGGQGGKSENSENRERVNFEVSETRRELSRPPGAIRRLTVAILVDNESITAEDGTVTRQPRSPEELAVLSELVASAAGINAERGDVLTLRSLDFLPPPETGSEASSSFLPRLAPVNLLGVLQIVTLAIVTLVLGLFVLRPLLLRSPAAARAGEAVLPLPGPGQVNGFAGVMNADPAMAALPGAPRAAGPVLTGEIEGAAGAIPETPEDPMERLRRLIAERQVESIEILRNWMEEDRERVRDAAT